MTRYKKYFKFSIVNLFNNNYINFSISKGISVSIIKMISIIITIRNV